MGLRVCSHTWLLQLLDLIKLGTLSLLVPTSERFQREVTLVYRLADLLCRLFGV